MPTGPSWGEDGSRGIGRLSGKGRCRSPFFNYPGEQVLWQSRPLLFAACEHCRLELLGVMSANIWARPKDGPLGSNRTRLWRTRHGRNLRAQGDNASVPQPLGLVNPFVSKASDTFDGHLRVSQRHPSLVYLPGGTSSPLLR